MLAKDIEELWAQNQKTKGRTLSFQKPNTPKPVGILRLDQYAILKVEQEPAGQRRWTINNFCIIRDKVTEGWLNSVDFRQKNKSFSYQEQVVLIRDDKGYSLFSVFRDDLVCGLESYLRVENGVVTRRHILADFAVFFKEDDPTRLPITFLDDLTGNSLGYIPADVSHTDIMYDWGQEWEENYHQPAIMECSDQTPQYKFKFYKLTFQDGIMWLMDDQNIKHPFFIESITNALLSDYRGMSTVFVLLDDTDFFITNGSGHTYLPIKYTVEPKEEIGYTSENVSDSLLNHNPATHKGFEDFFVDAQGRPSYFIVRSLNNSDDLDKMAVFIENDNRQYKFWLEKELYDLFVDDDLKFRNLVGWVDDDEVIFVPGGDLEYIQKGLSTFRAAEFNLDEGVTLEFDLINNPEGDKYDIIYGFVTPEGDSVLYHIDDYMENMLDDRFN